MARRLHADPAALAGGLALFLVGAGGCTPALDPASYVTGLRVLAIKAAPPEAAPGQTSTLTALAVDTQNRPINIDWAACLKAPLQGQLINPDCITNDTADYLQPLGSGLSIMVTMPMVSPLSLGLPDASGGFYLPVRGRVSAGSDSLTANYRLRLGTGQPPNHNPMLTGLFVVTPASGSPMDAGASGSTMLTALDPASPPVLHNGDQITLRAPFTADSAEMYQIPDPRGDGGTTAARTVTETLSVSWFATAGTISGASTGMERPDALLKLDTHLPQSGAVIDVYAVGHDERGGVDYLHGTLMFQ